VQLPDNRSISLLLSSSFDRVVAFHSFAIALVLALSFPLVHSFARSNLLDG
jgi:hypothetical protein